MRRRHLLFILLLSGALVLAQATAGFSTLSRAKGFVTDAADVLPPDKESSLERFLTYVEKKTAAEIAVVTVHSLQGEPIENYAVSLFEQWGIGKKDKDNGVLFLIAAKDRRMRIEVGYGLEGALPDGLCGSILDSYVVPSFRQGNMPQGIQQGTYAIAAQVGKEYNVDLLASEGLQQEEYSPSAVRRGSGARIFSRILGLLFFLFVVGGRFWFPLLLWGSPFRRSYWYGGSRYNRGGGSFSSGFGGGFGGFGGGMSGGGGASRGW